MCFWPTYQLAWKAACFRQSLEQYEAFQQVQTFAGRLIILDFLSFLNYGKESYLFIYTYIYF